MNKRILFSIIFIVLLATAGGYALWQTTQTSEQTGPSPSDQEEFNDSITENGEDSSRIEKDQVTRNETENNEQPETNEEDSNQTELERPRVTRHEQDDDEVRVAAIFEEQPQGTCVLRIAKEGEEAIQRTADIITAPTYYACEGFRIPVSEFPSNGEWTVTVTHKRGAEAVTSKVHTINVTK